MVSVAGSVQGVRGSPRALEWSGCAGVLVQGGGGVEGVRNKRRSVHWDRGSVGEAAVGDANGGASDAAWWLSWCAPGPA